MTHPDDAEPTGQANDGSPIHTAAANSVFNWRGAGSAAAAAPESPAASQQPNPEEEETMASTKTAKSSKRNGPQLALATQLAANDMSREAIAQALTELTPAQISSALNNSKAQGRIAWIEKDQVFRLTKSGKDWLAGLQGGAAAAPKRGHRRGGAAARKKGVRAKRAAATEKVDTSPKEEADGETFRCGVLSDGAFFISRGEVAIELDKDEHAEMLRYLERMAEA